MMLALNASLSGGFMGLTIMGLALLAVVAFFGLLFGFAYYGRKGKWSAVTRWGGGFIIAALIVGVAALRFNSESSSAAIGAESVSNVQEAKQFLLGTWTFTEPLAPNDPYIGQWEKWIVKDDGTVDVYSAFPTADDWGKPDTKAYEILTSKYTDTGKRFYYIRLKDMVVSASILKNDLIGLTISASASVPMRRGDRNPFSK
jgi:hypothetical protein